MDTHAFLPYSEIIESLMFSRVYRLHVPVATVFDERSILVVRVGSIPEALIIKMVLTHVKRTCISQGMVALSSFLRHRPSRMFRGSVSEARNTTDIDWFDTLGTCEPQNTGPRSVLSSMHKTRGRN